MGQKQSFKKLIADNFWKLVKTSQIMKPKPTLKQPPKNLVTFTVNEDQRKTSYKKHLEKKDITFKRAIVKLIAGFSKDIWKPEGKWKIFTVLKESNNLEIYTQQNNNNNKNTFFKIKREIKAPLDIKAIITHRPALTEIRQVFKQKWNEPRWKIRGARRKDWWEG